jgi:divalent metal cation (Fe/Co/Zn/Cd) transporter
VKGIIVPNLFTVWGFVGLVLVAFGVFLLRTSFERNNQNVRPHKKMAIFGLIVFGIGMVLLIVYLIGTFPHLPHR